MPEFDFDAMLHGIDMSLPEDGIKAPPSEYVPKEVYAPPKKIMAGKKVFVQKIITEIWVYTDIDGKSFGHQGIQDIVIVGDMDYNDAMKMIGDKKSKKPKNT